MLIYYIRKEYNPLALHNFFKRKGKKMDFSWLILGIVFLSNLFWTGVMFLTQQLDKNLPPRHSIIPGTNQKFMYMQDWHALKYGDLIGVPFIANMFVHLAVNGMINGWQWIIFSFIAVGFGLGFLKMCLSQNHKPDAGFPTTGKVSVHGLSHIPYFGIGWSMGLISIYHLIWGHISGLILYLGLFGAVFYFACFVAEFRIGSFDSLKRD